MRSRYRFPARPSSGRGASGYVRAGGFPLRLRAGAAIKRLASDDAYHSHTGPLGVWLAACLLAALLAGCIGDSNQNPSGQPGQWQFNQTKPPAKLSCAPDRTLRHDRYPVSSSRRQFIKRGGALAASSLTLSLLPASIQRALAIPANNRTGTLQDVEHIVILTQENRAFDHYFG